MDKGKIVSDIDACIVDMDGTLYFQGPVRIAMALRLGSFYLTHLFRIKELAALKLYREVREKEMFSGEDDFEGKQFEYVADKCGIDRERVEKTVSHWMHEVPLSLISKNRDEKLLSFLREEMRKGVKVIVYSDYPVSEKLKALEFSPDAGYYSADEIIGCMKPDPKGLINILEKYGLNKERVLFIGDRQEKDGECALKAGVTACILPRIRKKREAYYRYNL